MSSSSPSRQSRISTFFSPNAKRPADPSGDFPPPLKKRKASESRLPESSQPVASSSQKAAERWRFNLASPERGVPTPEVIVTREAFKRKLIPGNARKEPSVGKNPAAPDDHSDPAFDELSEFFSSKLASGKGKKAVRKPKPVEEIGPSGEKFTALEKQVLRLKKDNPGTLLMVEVGYKYKFFGEDARVAAKELGMVCFMDRNFLVASIPVPRRDIHLKKLLSQGYKVGIVQQVETAALKKASDNRNELFERKLVHLFTAATYVDGLDSTDELEKYTSPRLVCIVEEESEKGTATGTNVRIGMISVSASVGDVVWDAFEDTPMRIELETRLVHSKPTELLIPRNGLSQSTAKMLKHFTEVPTSSPRIRTEYFDEAMPFSEAFEFVSEFYASSNAQDPESSTKGRVLAAITDFPRPVVIALAASVQYLSTFDIADSLSQSTFFTQFTTKSHMLLAGNTLANLEIFQNETDFTTTGSLMWILDKTVTSFGARTLKNWVSKPLIDKCALELRIEAVEEILASSSDKLVSLRQLLRRLPDLGRGICRIQYKQCTPEELSVLLPAFYKIGNAFSGIRTLADVGFKSSVLNEIISSLPPLEEPMKNLLDAINSKETAAGNKERMWKDPSKYPKVEDNKLVIQSVEAELEQELVASKLSRSSHSRIPLSSVTVRKLLKLPSLKWTSTGGVEYLIEIKKSDKRPIPDSWLPAISATKLVARYHTPKVRDKLQERARWQESLQIEAKRAFLEFLDEVNAHYAILRHAVNQLAAADCLMSLAQVASRDNYVKPQFTDREDEDTLEIVNGRHPMVEALRSDPFVPNTILFSKKGRSKVITGPNMGGKSSCVRMVALLAIMAQIGSYVPATSFRLGLLDSVLTRMGAHDEIARGRSTFMVEMSETAEILSSATRHSLVILDELGRGTSTFDGMAIAYAVLNQLVASTQCKTLFITHYPLVALESEKNHLGRLENIHVGYHTEKRGIDGRRDVTFLYRLEKGIAPESFGVECARLAGLPESVLENATRQSLRMETTVAARAKRNMSLKKLQVLTEVHKQRSQIETVAVVENLRAIVLGAP
ncbi:muts domain V-domain-containing protein [Mycena rosella]|uniref:DNA mismatch repair protein MSH3 n=1 Tax=Mycena rosella TaxID=1033263 RepID=A0AAD7DLL6_MYCRO|nr:muts domain V-domain-containing protein [Mycena rosella]